MSELTLGTIHRIARVELNAHLNGLISASFGTRLSTGRLGTTGQRRQKYDASTVSKKGYDHHLLELSDCANISSSSSVESHQLKSDR